MKWKFSTILIASVLALGVLGLSQGIWLRNAQVQISTERKNVFQQCFNNSITELANDLMGRNDIRVYDDTGNEIHMGQPTAFDNESKLLEAAIIILRIEEESFKLSRLDSIINSCSREIMGDIILSNLSLFDSNNNQIDRVKYVSGISKYKNSKTYTAERNLLSLDKSYKIIAEYRIVEPNNLQKMGIATAVSLLSSITILVVLLYLLLIIKQRQKEIYKMQRSFHGAIHDLKSPLAYVFFQLSLMEDEETDRAKKASLSLTADRVSFLTDKIMRLLKSAQSIDKIDESDKTEVSLYDLLEQIESEMHTMFPKKKIRFKYQVNADFTMYVISDLIEASIRIIIENAVKFSGEAPDVVISAFQDVDNIKISIADNGVGMSRRQMKNIFKPYFTTDTLQGNGIGLYYAQSIVKAHNGKISVKSEAGKGSEFIITLPNR